MIAQLMNRQLGDGRAGAAAIKIAEKRLQMQRGVLQEWRRLARRRTVSFEETSRTLVFRRRRLR